MMTVYENMLEHLAEIDLFKDLSTDELQMLKVIINPVTFPADHVIVKEGDTGDTMYMIVKGDVEILKRTVFGEEYTCDYLPEAMHLFFGEFSLLDHGERSATVKSVTPVEALTMNRDPFLAFCEDHKTIGYKIMKRIAFRMASRLRKADKDILTLFEALVDEIGSY